MSLLTVGNNAVIERGFSRVRRIFAGLNRVNLIACFSMETGSKKLNEPLFYDVEEARKSGLFSFHEKFS